MPPRKTASSSEVLQGVLEALPLGQKLWVRGVTRDLAPLLRQGDAVRVLRCGPGDISPGDIALVRQGTRLTAQVVVSTGPWMTTTLLGTGARPGGALLGRVVSLRRGRWLLPLPRPLSPALWVAQRGLATAWGQRRTRLVYRAVRDFFFSGWSKPLRRHLVGPLEVRLLRPVDLEVLLVFAGERLSVSATFLRRQLGDRWGRDAQERRGAAVGALDTKGRMHGFAWMDSYREEGLPLDGVWVRSLVVAPQARRMGVATQLVSRLLEEAHRQGEPRVQADVDEDNDASLRTFEGLGFQRASAALTEQTNEAWDAAGSTKRLIVFERDSAP
ncbi:GNAT family N-acetyltransferase [Myxococcus landrumensis]|uniref:GNAT family N-acetyltransferase n=1 Tax=Myxococcus landrumensis TaxID=2813577 RepID=A0ABX7N429_9BACT|nr:GNAT family N-acetyltransferase [Myxococcus landrumus]QSQ13368.1 GNAT family N-acetyltransferase [Myxococcus landrumus]